MGNAWLPAKALHARQCKVRCWAGYVMQCCQVCLYRGRVSSTCYSHGQQTQSHLDVHLATWVIQKSRTFALHCSTHPPSEGHAHTSEPPFKGPWYEQDTAAVSVSHGTHDYTLNTWYKCQYQTITQQCRTSVTWHTLVERAQAQTHCRRQHF